MYGGQNGTCVGVPRTIEDITKSERPCMKYYGANGITGN